LTIFGAEESTMNQTTKKAEDPDELLPATQGGLRIAGVEICKIGDRLTKAEVHRRFETARAELDRSREQDLADITITPPASDGAVHFARVEICKADETITRAELDQRCKQAEQAFWRAAEERGVWPPPPPITGLPPAFEALDLGGVKFCDPGEILSKEEFHRRYETAKETFWQILRGRGNAKD